MIDPIPIAKAQFARPDIAEKIHLVGNSNPDFIQNDWDVLFWS